METALLILAAFTAGTLGVVWGVTPRWREEWFRSLKQKEGGKSNSNRVIAVVLGLVLLGLGAALAVLELEQSGPSTSPSSFRESAYLPRSTRQKIFYDIISVQDQNPDSEKWDQEVKEAAARHYRVSISRINSIIHEGVSEGWLQPDPP